MESLHQDFRVQFHYDVHFTRGVFQTTNPTLLNVISSSGQTQRKILVVIEESIRDAFPALLDQIARYAGCNPAAMQLVADPLLVPGGEVIKQSEDYVFAIRSAIHQYGICRHSFVIAIGGGALLDMVGYAAATAHRGVRLIRLPTTVLSQNDSGVGVKNSVNLFGKKNFIGTFAPPYAVINDLEFLSTLSDRDWRSGLAEAVKVALIKDVYFFQELETLVDALNRRDPSAIESVIYRCAKLHLQHIATGDPFEMGSSRPLDFGHWSAHKIEQLTAYQIRHGEAVAIGIALDCTYSYLVGLLPKSAWERIIDLLLELGFELSISQIDIPELVEGLNEFREHLGGRLTILLLSAIGQAVEVHQMEEQVIARSAALLNQCKKVLSTNCTK